MTTGVDAARHNAGSEPPGPPLLRGEARFWRVSFALFLSGLATFALLYCVQPLLPEFARDFSLSPASASLSLSATTGVLAFAMFGAGALSDAYGRKRVMAVALFAAAATTLAAAAAPNWPALIAFRALTGLTLAGLPAVAMAYLAEEMDRTAVGLSMGLFIAGNTFGGMGGRLATAAIAEAAGWRWALAALGAASVACATAFAFALPRERRALPRAELVALWPAIRMHCADPGLRLLFALGFLLMGAFVTTYNYIGFRLAAPPFSLSQTAIGFVFVLYLLGTVASTVAGDLSGRFGRRKVILPAVALMPLGALATLSSSLWVTIAGVALVTVGFFAGHSIASSWIGLRAATAQAQASALYLFFYYAGSSLAGWCGGWALGVAGWPGVAAFVTALTCLACAAALRLSRVPPPAHLAQPAPPLPPG
ncbi:YNFM family putative membrane transporter [Roseiarcus fermentans]|uniref:YNFM family putative membrane transporter n=1 Tax=Roseiarcus fermentans TaxID=1473586 RepID=A0A366EYF7_9HYPH|nr:MFS transporter [Roseiarcus fermentans]RBP07432.1 YNFM family putative membrane transporter [Roseiarcus fermentans]